jgi:hypothetical protein
MGPLPRLPRLSSGKQQPRLASVVVVNPGVGNIALTEPRERRHWSHSSTPPSRAGVSMPEGPLSQHSHPLPTPSSPQGPPAPPPNPPPPKHHHRFELRVIPRTLAMDITEGVLANALVAFIGGSRPQVSPEQVHVFLECIMRLQEDDVQIKHYDYSGADFMLIFASRQLTDQVLHATQPQDTGFLLIF